MNYLANAFSINMIPVDNFTILQVKRVESKDVPSDVVSAIGHPDTARVVEGILGYKVPCNRMNLKLEEGDTLYVAQYTGPRLPEGATQLPEGANLEFFRVILRPECCVGCQAYDCNGCIIMDLTHGV